MAMASPDYALTMARYNRWQNANLLRAADRIGVDQLALDRGAFFGSIEKTFHHIYWADRIWMSRFSDVTAPAGGIADSVNFDGGWDDFRDARTDLDDKMLTWAKGVRADWFDGDLTWFSGAMGRELSKPKRLVVMHIFNHQTHHRGQIHAMLTAAGERPGDTDIPFMPDDYATA
ncbi:DinB family protein [Paracoccus sp. (in: a-proteobacteria)]|uniref:DinB family protein n=1 Tax=Paracoccus sp. TaxID=267 RepID=UPI004057F35C